MAKTYSDYLAQIEEIRLKAEAVKLKEAAGVIERIKSAIAYYGLTAADLGFGDTASTRVSPGKAAAAPVSPRKAAGKKSAVAAKFHDAAGNSWSGRGPKPAWFKAALAAGTPVESLMTGDAEPAVDVPAGKKAGAAKKPAPAVKFKDDAGHSWSGRGPKPKWFVEALAAGKTPDDLKA